MTVTAKLQKLGRLYNPLYCQSTLNVCLPAPCWAVFSCQIPILQLSTLRVKEAMPTRGTPDPQVQQRFRKGDFKFPLSTSPVVSNILNPLLSSRMRYHLAGGGVFFFFFLSPKGQTWYLSFIVNRVGRAHSFIRSLGMKDVLECFLKC